MLSSVLTPSPVTPSADACTVVVPAARPVTHPLFETAAMSLSLLVHSTGMSAIATPF